ncbi:MAG: cadherin-like beta sandwich domain-containing protein [Gammaproteobacteria bacterium]|nr:cadherin-like beta sandwich domain-containing protein [Gammaproteobacteria bacterium]
MLKRFFTGLLATAAVLFAASAQAQVTPPTNITLTPTAGAESTAMDLGWTEGTAPSGSGGVGWYFLNMRVFGEGWGTLGSQTSDVTPEGVTVTGNRDSRGGLNPGSPSAQITGLQPATTYELRMRTYDEDAQGSAFSATAQAVTLSGDSPGKPALSLRGFSAKPGAMTWRATLQWSAASNAGTVTKNHLRWRTSAQDPDGTPGNSDDVAAGTWQNAAGDDADCADGAANPENCGEEISAEIRRYEITGLAENTDYDFQARQENSIGVGSWSDILTFTVDGVSGDNSLSALVVNDGNADVELSPAFRAGTLAYAAEIRNSINNLSITPTAADGTATIKIGRAGSEAAVDSGSASSQSVNKTSGSAAQGPAENTFNVEVTAENGDVRVYKISVSRLKASADASLSALRLVTGSTIMPMPAFDPGTLSYDALIRNNTTTLTITATANDAAASGIKIGRPGALAAATSGAGAAQTIDKTSALAAQDASLNTFQIEVTAEDGSTQTYTLAVSRRAASDDAALSALRISHGALFPAFSPGVTSYYAAIGNDVAQFTITPTPDAAAMVQVGRAGFLGAPSQAQGTEVGRGNNVFLVVVTSENSAVTRTYTIDVFRGGAISKLLIHDADENSRTDANSLLPTADFSQTVPAYSLVVQKSVTAVVITTTLTAGAASYQRIRPTVTPASSASLTSGTASSAVPLAGGENLILVKVSTAEYPVTILRPADAPENLAANPKTEKLRVSWDAVAGTTTYRLRWRTKTGPGAWQSASGDDDAGEEAGAAPRYTITGLTNATNYEVQARADNPAGDGEWSESVEAAPAAGVEISAELSDLAFIAAQALPAAITLPNASGGTTPYTFTLTGLPAGLAFDDVAREISGTPSAATAAPAEVAYRVTDANSEFDERIFSVDIVTFNPDVDESGARDARDGILIARYLLGVRGDALTKGQSAAAFGEVEAEIKPGADGILLDVNEDGNADGDDGILIARYLFGLRGAELTAGFSNLDADAIAAKIAGLLP